MSEQPSSAANQSTTQSAGDMLRSARERKGLSIEQAAAHLNLRPSLVSDLENEHYEQLRIPTYRRGYLRAYARLLEIEPEQVLKAHDDKHGKVDEPIKVSTPIKPLKRPSRIGKVAFWIITIIIVLLIIGLTTQWWKNRNGNDFNTPNVNTPSAQIQNQQSSVNTGPQSSTPAASSTTGSANTAANRATTASPEASNGVASNTGAAPNTGTNGNAAGNTTTANNSSNDLQMQVGNGVDGANMTTSEAESESQQSQSNGNQNVNSQGTSIQSGSSQNSNSQNGTSQSNSNQINTDTTAAATSSNGITLQFNSQSWTRITDASGHTLLTGLQPAGSQRTITGQPPFHLVVGNATGVSVTYQGQPVHLGSRNVARLTLGH